MFIAGACISVLLATSVSVESGHSAAVGTLLGCLCLPCIMGGLALASSSTLLPLGWSMHGSSASLVSMAAD
jgi:hypothetical protein